MYQRDRLLAAISGKMADRLPFAPRIDLWFEANRRRGALPAEFKEIHNPDDVSRKMGWAINKVILEFQGHGEDSIIDRPLGIYRVPGQGFLTHLPPDVERRVVRNGDSRHLEYRTPKGNVQASFVYTEEMKKSGVTIPWIDLHILKSPADYAPVGYIFENLIVEPNPEGYLRWSAPVGMDGLAAVYALTSGSPLHHVLKVLIDTTQFYYHFRDYPKEMMGLAEKIGIYFRKVFAAAAEIPAEVILVGANFDDTITYPPFFRDHIFPWLQEASEILHAKSKKLLCHTDGENSGLMDFLAESGMDVADSVCPAPMTRVPISEYYRKWKNITIIGGVPSNLLLSQAASDEEFDLYVDELFKAVAPGDRFIVGVADAVPPDAVFDRLRRLGDRIEKEAQLPLTGGAFNPVRTSSSESSSGLSSEKQASACGPMEAIHKELSAGRQVEIKEQIKALLEQGVSAADILNQGLLGGMESIGEKFRQGLVFVPEVLLASRAMNEALTILEPFLANGESSARGRFLIGTVKGDMHDIGKNIVCGMLRGVGFEIMDLGINVPIERFIKAVKEFRPHILGLSALLTTTMPEMRKIIKALEEEGLRSRVKVIVGGAPVNATFAEQIGADGYASNAGEGVQIAKQLSI